LKQNDIDEALKAYFEASKAAGRAIEIEPNEPDYFLELSTAQWEIGVLRSNQEKFEIALRFYEMAEESLRKAIHLKDSDAGYRHNLYLLLGSWIAPLQEKLGHRDDALNTYREALAAVEKAATLDPKNTKYRDDRDAMRIKLKSNE
jgi:tetratricopeptide (TPR) repeat protein